MHHHKPGHHRHERGSHGHGSERRFARSMPLDAGVNPGRRRHVGGRHPPVRSWQPGLPAARHDRVIGFPSQPRLALRKRRRPFLDLRRCGQHRRVRLRFRAGRADQLHVDADRDGTCRQPIRASHLAMRISRKHPRRRLWLRDRENWIHDIFRAELTDRNPGGGAVLVCVASARKCDTRPGAPWIRLIAAQSYMGASSVPDQEVSRR